MYALRSCTAACRSRQAGARYSSLRLRALLYAFRTVSSEASSRSPVAYGGSSRKKPVHRLYVAGANPFLPSHVSNATIPTFTEVPLHDWISSVSGRGSGLSRRSTANSEISKEDIEITHVASGLGHAMIAYRDMRNGEEKIFAIGRNESGQLGVGYNSQEPTRGLVEGFEGDHIQDIRCGITSTYLQVRQGDRSVLYVCGNQHRGQLGVPVSDNGNAAPSQSFLSAACKVDLPGQSVKQIACGYEHLLLLTEHGLLLGTGINTDGQLGTGDDLDRHILSPIKMPDTTSNSRIASVEAGADTSALITEDGTLHTFGNSEYAQAFHGEKIDRIMTPKFVDPSTFAGSSKIQSFKTAGSASLLLADDGRVFSAGFGAIGQGKDQLAQLHPTEVTRLTDVVSIYVAYGCAIVVDAEQNMYVLGLNSSTGRLGITSSANAYTPTKLSALPQLDTSEPSSYEIAHVAIARDACFIHVRDYSN